MHVHLPKPLHGWREFLGEVGIIVFGVLIALTAEQLIEKWHWQHKADEAIASIREEITVNYDQSAEAASVAPCIDRQLVTLEDGLGKPVFTGAPSYADAALNRFVVRLPSRPWPDSAWKTAISEGTVSHLPAELRRAYQNMYQQIAIMDRNARDIDVISWRLRALSLPAGAGDRARSIEAIEELRGHVDFMALVGNQIMGQADAVGMRPSAKEVEDIIRQSGTIAFCRAHNIPVGRPAPERPS